MPAERLVQQMWRVPARRPLQSALEIVFQRGTEMGMGAFLDDEARPLPRRQTSEIGKTLFRNDDLNVMLRMVDMSGHGNDARDRSALRNGWRHEE